ncbi:MAG TPA: radical SAM protein [Candidatus Polarisedimenticolia bacterium]|nr:radical SAM protein [Candidatus Polarisedimenticolia bacterium]
MIVHEIFHSIQGESTRAGLPCTFVRLTGCPLRCVYCDTQHAFHEGSAMTVEEVRREVARLPGRFVTVTGGEPLAQDEVHPLMRSLADDGYDVQLETSGALDIAPVDRRVRVILDIKTPGSGMEHRMDWSNLGKLKSGDEVKIVLMSRGDYQWSAGLLRRGTVPAGVPVLLSPAHGLLDPRDLAAWMTGDGIEARLQLQIHKYIWGPDCRGV